MKLFVDTSAWAATYNASDRWHTRARAALDSLVDSRTVLITTDYVLDETITLLLYHAGRSCALAFGDAVLRSRQVQLVRIGARMWEEAWQLFRRYEDKAWAFTDCTSFVVMRQRELTLAFTFDNHFAQAGFELWPQACS